MNRWTNMLDPNAETALRKEIGSIPGVEIRRITAMPPVRNPNSNKLDVVITLNGWSPCLNLISMVWEATVEHGESSAFQLGDLTIQLADHLLIQRRRQTEALSLGRASPFDVCDDDGHRDDTQIDHILIDPLLAEMIGQGETLIREVGNTIWDIHYDLQLDRSGLEELLQGEQTPEYGESSPGTHGVFGRIFLFDKPIPGTGMIYDGLHLTVPGRLPETMLSACAGRRLGDVVDQVPPALADRIITGAHQGGDALLLSIEPVTVSIGEIAARESAQ